MGSLKSKESEKSRAVGREEIIAAIQAAVEANGGKLPAYRVFLKASNFKECQVKRLFGKWTEAQKAAGCVFKRPNDPVDSAALLEDWGRLARKLGWLPTTEEYNALGTHSSVTVGKRFGAWSKVPAVFRKFVGKDGKWADVIALIPETGPAGNVLTGSGRLGRRPSPFAQARLERIAHRAVCGSPLHFEGMSHAPVNEAGVLFLFGAVAPKLGFTVESLRPGFPDCQAKRRIGPEAWQTVSIEFEYESRNFKAHGHPPGGCDLIVCWRHNWPECPLKVIALSDEIARLRKADAGVEFLAA